MVERSWSGKRKERRNNGDTKYVARREGPEKKKNSKNREERKKRKRKGKKKRATGNANSASIWVEFGAFLLGNTKNISAVEKRNET